MNAKELREVIKIHFEKKVPLLIYGPPGIGKSQITRETAEELGVEFIDLRLSLLDPTDLRGFPYVDKEKNITRWAIPEFFPRDEKSQGILLLDEINLAPPMVQNASYQLILDRSVGEYKLPDGWSIVAAGNISPKEGYITQIRSALLSRFSVVELEPPTAKDWVMEYAIPRGIDSRIIGFLSSHPDALMSPALSSHQTSAAAGVSQIENFPNPRNWEVASRLIIDQKDDLDTVVKLVELRVGAAVSTLFRAFLQLAERVDPESWKREGVEGKIPSTLEEKFYLLTVLVTELDPAARFIRAISGSEPEVGIIGLQMLKSKFGFDKIVGHAEWPKIAKLITEYI